MSEPVQGAQPNSSTQELSDEAKVRIKAHNAEYKRSMSLLEQAREDAGTKYNSAAVRKTMTEECKKRTNGKIVPHPWQLDVAECIILGIDTELIAATGAGKTIPFVLPLFVFPKKCIVVVAPLIALQENQEARFKEFGIKAKAVNGESWKKASVRRNVRKGKYQIIITSPEMCLKQPQFRSMLEKPNKKRKIAAFIVDEAHCILQWGDSFRLTYAELGTLRAFVPERVPFLVTSATLSPHDLIEIRKSIHMLRYETVHVNLGNDRPNISWECRTMKAAMSDTDSLSFLLPDDKGPSGKLEHGIVFFDTIENSMVAMRAFQKQLPEHLRGRVKEFNALLGPATKQHVLDHFNNGDIDILFSTEAAGMGCDMSRVRFVVQFMVPLSLAIWLQRAGRAGRDANSHGIAILLVQPTVFQEKGKKKRLPGEAVQYVKEVEDGLRDWIQATSCRRDVADIQFNNPVSRKPPMGECCDICTRIAAERAAEQAPAEARGSLARDEPMPPSDPLPQSNAEQRPRNDSVVTHDSSSENPNDNGKRPMREPEHEPIGSVLGPEKSRGQHRADRREALELWRSRTWKQVYATRPVVPFGILGLMPEVTMTAFIANLRWRTVADVTQSSVKQACSWWGLEEHGHEVFAVLEAVDLRYRQAKKQKEDEELAKANAKVVRAEEEAATKERERQAEKRRKEDVAAKKRQDKEETDAKVKAARETKQREAEQKRVEAATLKEEKRLIAEGKKAITESKRAQKEKEKQERQDAAVRRAQEKAEKEMRVNTTQHPPGSIAGPSRCNDGAPNTTFNTPPLSERGSPMGALPQPSRASGSYPRARMVRRLAQGTPNTLNAPPTTPTIHHPTASLPAQPSITPRQILHPHSHAALAREARLPFGHPTNGSPLVQPPTLPFFAPPSPIQTSYNTPSSTAFNTPSSSHHSLLPPNQLLPVFAQQPHLAYPTPSHTTFNSPQQQVQALWAGNSIGIVQPRFPHPFANSTPSRPLTPTYASVNMYTPRFAPSPRAPPLPLPLFMSDPDSTPSQHIFTSAYGDVHSAEHPHPVSPSPAPRLTIAVQRTVSTNTDLDLSMFFSPR